MHGGDLIKTMRCFPWLHGLALVLAERSLGGRTKNTVHESALATATDSGDDRETADWNADLNVPQVVRMGAIDGQPAFLLLG